MSDRKQNNLLKSQHYFKINDIPYKEFNNGTHWKIDTMDFWPTTHAWQDKDAGVMGQIGLETFINYFKQNRGLKRKETIVVLPCPHCNWEISISIV